MNQKLFIAFLAAGLAILPLAAHAANSPATTPSAAESEMDRSSDIPVRHDWQQSMRSIQAEMNRMFRNAFGPDDTADWSITTGMFPATDLIENDKNFIIDAEIPGTDPDSIDISAAGDELTIKGAKKNDNTYKSESYLRHETAYGSFERTIRLPPTADLEKADAVYKDGVLTLTIPKKAGVATTQRKIPVRHG